MDRARGDIALCDKGARTPTTSSLAASTVAGAQATGGVGVAVTTTSCVTIRVTSAVGAGVVGVGDTAGDGVTVGSNTLQLAEHQTGAQQHSQRNRRKRTPVGRTHQLALHSRCRFPAVSGRHAHCRARLLRMIDECQANRGRSKSRGVSIALRQAGVKLKRANPSFAIFPTPLVGFAPPLDRWHNSQAW